MVLNAASNQILTVTSSCLLFNLTAVASSEELFFKREGKATEIET